MSRVSEPTALSKHMSDRAQADRLPLGHPVYVTAMAFDKACVEARLGEPGSLKRMLGCWARARMAWRDYSGEDLI